MNNFKWEIGIVQERLIIVIPLSKKKWPNKLRILIMNLEKFTLTCLKTIFIRQVLQFSKLLLELQFKG